MRPRLWITGIAAAAVAASAGLLAVPQGGESLSRAPRPPSAERPSALSTTGPSSSSASEVSTAARTSRASGSAVDSPRLRPAARKKSAASTKTVSAEPAPWLQPYLSPSTVAASLRTIRLVNYYPAYHGWSRMWFEWDPQAIWDDFRAIRAMNANAVRLILHVDVFGYPIPSLTMTERLASAVSMAEAQGLRVQLTLFDNWSQYGDLENSKRWARAILAPYEADTRIALVEVKNEMDPRDTAAIKWARAMIPYMRGVARRPVVASARVFGADSLYGFGRLVKALQGTGRPDAYSFHYYGPHAEARQRFASARNLAGTTPIWIGETGFADATYASAPPDPEKENEQAFYLYQVELAAGDLGLGAAAPWTLRDFAPGTLTSTSPGYEYRMGLIRLDGTRKPAYDAVKLVFGWFVEKYGN